MYISPYMTSYELTEAMIDMLPDADLLENYAQIDGWVSNPDRSYTRPDTLTGPTRYSRNSATPREDLCDTVAALTVHMPTGYPITPERTEFVNGLFDHLQNYTWSPRPRRVR